MAHKHGVCWIYDGVPRAKAAQIGGVTRRLVQDWVVKFNALSPEGLIDRKSPGLPPKLKDAHRAALVAIIEQSPIPAVHGLLCWRLVSRCTLRTLRAEAARAWEIATASV